MVNGRLSAVFSDRLTDIENASAQRSNAPDQATMMQDLAGDHPFAVFEIGNRRTGKNIRCVRNWCRKQDSNL